MMRTAAPLLSLAALVAIGLTGPAEAWSEQLDPGSRDRTPAHATRIYVGMWTSHVRDLSAGASSNSLLGLSVRGVYGATFINSFGDRTFAAGIQRGLTSPGAGALRANLEYRIGLVTGYDERFMSIASRVPALPFAQLVGRVDRGRLGVELAYAGLTTSVLLNVRP